MPSDYQTRRKTFNAISWRNFPTDKTMKEFRTDYQQATNQERHHSDAWLRGAVNALEDGDGEKTIFDDLFSPRDSEDNSDLRAPRLIPYETQELLFAIATVRDEDKNLKGDAFAERVFAILAKKEMAKKKADRYADILTLSQPRIQQELLRNFEELLRQRLELLYSHIFMNPAGIQIDELKRVLEQIDYLLRDFSDKPSDYESTSAKLDLQTLYTALLALRKEVLVKEAVQDNLVERLNWRDKNDDLVKMMNKQLLKTSRSPNPKQISAFLRNYNEYLMKYLDSETKEQAAVFVKEYRALSDYYFSDMDAAQFEEIVVTELEDFSRAIFDELDRMELVDAASDYQPKSAVVGYLRLRLTEVQETIVSKIREPMRLLRAVYSLQYFSNKDILNPFHDKNKQLPYDAQKMKGMSNRMIVTADDLLEECKNMLPPIEETLTLEEKILAAYDYVFSPVYEKGIIGVMRQHLPYILSTAQNGSIQYLFAVTNLLGLMCKIYVGCECKRHTEILLAEYDRMRSLLKK